MAIFSFKLFKKKKTGTSSNIAQLRSPYFKKPSIPEKAAKRAKRLEFLVAPPRRLQTPKKSRTFLWIIAFLIVSGIGIYSIFFSNFFHIQNWEAQENGNLLEKDDPVNEILSAERGKSIFFINEKNIIDQIKALHPDIQKIQIKKILPKKIKVEFEKYPIAANIINVVGKAQKKLLVDSVGLIVDENNENPELPYIKILTTEAFAINSQALPEKKLNYVLTAIKSFEEKFGMKVVDAEYMIREREVHLRTEKYFTVWIDMEKDLAHQLDKLKKASAKLDIYKTPLEYIDLRISGTDNEKVIFKPRTT